MFCIQLQLGLVAMLYLCPTHVLSDIQEPPIDCFRGVPNRRQKNQFEMLKLKVK